MKRLSLYLFLLLFTLQTSSWADDISDFEIEGMSIGDSLLDYVSEGEITKEKYYYPKSKKFVAFVKKVSSFKTYESFRVHFKDDDKKYIIKSLEGVISYKNNIEDCYKKMDEIVEELSSIFKDAYKNETKTRIHPADKSGKSKFTDAQFILQSGDGVRVVCYDWGAKTKVLDTLNVDMSTKEIIYFLDNEAY